MDLTITLIGVVLVAIAIWVFLGLKRFRHKIFAIFLIALILFFYFSFTFVFSGKPLDISTMNGITQAGGTYFSWLGSVFGNFLSLTTHVIKMNWGGNSSLNQTNSTG